IFLLAPDIPPIQATSVPCEQVFSSAKYKTETRNLLVPDLMKALQILKFLYKKNGVVMLGLNLSQHFDHNNDICELEVITDNTDLANIQELQNFVSTIQKLLKYC
ncbi:hypothetical protein L218DRAFT_886419, partial [Marasmius fiardii PR-910]